MRPRPSPPSPDVPGPHGGCPLVEAGPPAAEARGAVILLHGRGADARDILGLAAEWGTGDLLFVAPSARGGAWYPDRFVAPLERNEPWLSSALAAVTAVSDGLAAAGVPHERQAVAGFSQGGCLALEWGARNARRRAGLIGFSAGLIGPPGIRWDHRGDLAGTPVFLGCGEPDPHIPTSRVRESAEQLRMLGGDVQMHLYPGLGHSINREEIRLSGEILDAIG